jgi:hypothetical protein
MKTFHHFTAAFLLLQLAGCNRPPEPGGEDAEEEGTLSDVPCGGVDLKSDDLNCGSCGNACYVDWPGTKYAAGGCVDGECGPNWTEVGPLASPPDIQTCEAFCALGEFPCVPRGCSGMTAFVCGKHGDFGNECDLGDPDNYPIVEFTGECDEPIPYPKDDELYSFINFACCCDF